MGQVSVNLGINTELMKDAKYDRFMPNVGMNIDISDLSGGTDISAQIDAQAEAIRLIWKKLSSIIEDLSNEELDYSLHWRP